MKLMRCCLYTLMILGLFLFVGSLVMYFVFPNMVANKVKLQLPLRNGSASLTKWSRVTVPIYLKVYVFDIQNGDEVANNRAVPVLVQRGPYTFFETREKIVLDFSNDSEVIHYQDIKRFYFMPELSNGTLQDEVNFINVPLIGMLGKIGKMLASLSVLGSLVVSSINGLVQRTGEKIIARRTVGELLFDGYKVDLFEGLSTSARNFGVTLPPFLPNNTFGLMYGKNGTSAGMYSINSGVSNVLNLNTVEAFRGRRTVPHWSGATCNAINGTDGSSFHPQVTREEILYMFNADLCRSLYFDYDHDSQVRGIPTYKFSLPDSFFQAPSRRPDNECFCTQPEGLKSKLCQIDGILDISQCRKGAPVVISAPHFFQGDAELLQNVSGLHPDRKLHETFVEINPLTGLVMNAARRIQININVKHSPDVPALKGINSMIMPVMWLEEVASADEPSAMKFKSLIQNKLVLGNAILISAMTIGIAVFLIALAIYIFKSSRQEAAYSAKEKEAMEEMRSPRNDYSPIPVKEPLDSM
ncbi:Lysosome membrane protein 2 [Halotydeus destructor]|nr:Lysosome membrane protein 2 [Halotydeus destructor]